MITTQFNNKKVLLEDYLENSFQYSVGFYLYLCYKSR